MASWRYRWGDNTWKSINPGAVRSRWGGGWFAPHNIRAKVGVVGGGYWTDTGYIGYPNKPGSIWVHAWDFSNVAIGFTGPSGGAPVAYYELLQQDSNGGNIAHVGPIYGSPWGNFAVGQDGYYQFWVRSIGTTGLPSDWTGPVRVKIGHTEQGYYATENRTRGWTSASVGGPQYFRGQHISISFGSNFYVQSMHWRNLRTNWGNVITPIYNTNGDPDYGWASFNYVTYGGDGGSISDTLGQVWSGDNRDIGGWNHAGNGSDWGLWLAGSGWTSWADPNNPWGGVDALWLQGYEVYQVQVYYKTRDYEGNSYW